MKITKIETLTNRRYPQLMWVRLHTDGGLVGLGETTQQGSEATARIIQTRLATLLIGQDPTEIELLWDRMFRTVHYHGYAGAEMRAISAVDIALWDLLGKITGLPVYVLLGGRCRDRILTYNTCGSYAGFPDHERSHDDPGALAKDLLASGIRAMKIWPFDDHAAGSRGHHITAAQLENGAAKFRAIREAVGDEMEIALEGHCLWSLPSAIRIAKAVEPYRPMWLEELMMPDDPQATATLRRSTSTPLVSSERLMTRFAFQSVLAAGAADIVMLDINWTGGLTESKKIAAMASTHQLPVCPHNPGGPICHVVAAHFCASVPNLFIMESVRAYYLTWFKDIVSVRLLPVDGHFPLPGGPGLGVELNQAFLADPETLREETVRAEDQPDYATGNPYRSANQWRQSEARGAPAQRRQQS